MSIADDQALVRAENERRKAAGITYRSLTATERWNDVKWLQQRVTELERWHVPESGPGHPRLELDGDYASICRGEHGAEGCQWETYVRTYDDQP